jgi:hypothetical protein
MTIDKDKIKRQLELEEESVQLGVQRYREQVKDTPVSEMPPGLALLHRAMEPLAQAIDSFTNTSRRGGARMHQTRDFLKHLDPYDAAYITSRMLLNSIASVINIQTIAINLTNTLIARSLARRPLSLYMSRRLSFSPYRSGFSRFQD